MPSNEQTNKDNTTNTHYDYQFLDYRLDQLEHKIGKGLDRLELEQTNNYKEILKTLHLMQDGNNEQNKQLVEISQRQQSMEEQLKCIDRLKEVATSHKEQLSNIYHRFGIYQKIFFILGTATATALITAFFNLLTK